jgi:hypothetical protein
VRWRPSPVTAVVAVAVLPILISIFVNWATSTLEMSGTGWTVAMWTTVALLAAAATLVEVRRFHRRSAVSLDEAKRALAEAILRQWVDDAVTRGLYDPAPLRVGFAAPHRKVGVPAADVAGDAHTITQVFRSIPARRLVILGEPGAGKSVLTTLLTKGLLEKREPGEPVPVLLSAVSWHPGEGGEHLHTWLARRLSEEYPFLNDAARFGPHTAAGLIESGHILPVVDGLDELPQSLHAAAVRGLNHALAHDTAQLVVTWRTQEFTAAVAAAGQVVSRTAVVEVQPLAVADISEYLTRGQDDQQWRDVLKEIEQNPNIPAARALATPLGVVLARIRYPIGTDATDLLRIHDPLPRLLEGFVEAALRADIPAVGRQQWKVTDTQRWLILLARTLNASGTKELAWWRLRDNVPRAVRISLVALWCVALTWFLHPALCATFTVVCALTAGVPAHGPGPKRLRLTVRRRQGGPRLEPVLACAGVGAAGGMLTTNLIAIAVGAAIGLALGMAASSISLLTDTQTAGPQHALRDDRRSSLWGGAALGLSTALALWLIFQHSTPPLNALVAATVGAIVALGRWTAFAAVAAYLLGWKLSPSLDYYFGSAWVVATWVAVVTVTVAVLWATGPSAVGLSAWAQWSLVARVWYPLTGQLPWAVNAFLDHAHRLGIVRKVGQTYQFRHQTLLDHLAHKPD